MFRSHTGPLAFLIPCHPEKSEAQPNAAKDLLSLKFVGKEISNFSAAKDPNIGS
jgi:hypothetical protein